MQAIAYRKKRSTEIIVADEEEKLTFPISTDTRRMTFSSFLYLFSISKQKCIKRRANLAKFMHETMII